MKIGKQKKLPKRMQSKEEEEAMEMKLIEEKHRV